MLWFSINRKDTLCFLLIEKDMLCFLWIEKRHVMFSINRKRHVTFLLLLEKHVMFVFPINRKTTCYEVAYWCCFRGVECCFRGVVVIVVCSLRYYAMCSLSEVQVQEAI